MKDKDITDTSSLHGAAPTPTPTPSLAGTESRLPLQGQNPRPSGLALAGEPQGPVKTPAQGDLR